MTTLRSFIAIELSSEAAVALAEVQNRLKKIVPPGTVRWTPPENIHLTLHFLGDVDAGQVEQIVELLEASASTSRPFSLTLTGLGCFPNARRPRIVWVGILGDTKLLINFQRDLGERLQRGIGFKPEDRPYSPHLTIGRVKNGLASKQLGQLGQLLAQTELGQVAGLDVSAASLMKSDLNPGGAVYTQLVNAPLGGE